MLISWETDEARVLCLCVSVCVQMRLCVQALCLLLQLSVCAAVYVCTAFLYILFMLC